MSGYTREMAIEEDGLESVIQYEEQARERAEKSYPKGEEYKYCSHCGQLMPYRSMAYDEGYHFDSCY